MHPHVTAQTIIVINFQVCAEFDMFAVDFICQGSFYNPLLPRKKLLDEGTLADKKVMTLT